MARAMSSQGLAQAGHQGDDRPCAGESRAMPPCVVTSTAIKGGNPEVDAALERRVPVIRRAEMLAELMRLKSTVAVARNAWQDDHHIYDRRAAGCRRHRPDRHQWRHHQRLWLECASLGEGDWMVVEADESDGSFQAAPRRYDCGRHQYRSRASRSLWVDGGAAEGASIRSWRTRRSMALPCCALITRKCRRSPHASPTGGGSPMASIRRPIFGP